MSLIPKNRPRQTRQATEQMLRSMGVEPIREPFVILGVRGYYKRTMGTPEANDRGLYDDAIFLLTTEQHVAFNANLDPERSKNPKGRPTLIPGVWRVYRFDLHNGQYLALCQRAGEVQVRRELTGEIERGWFGINLHRGGSTWTGSEGCLTIPPGQWKEFIDLAASEAKRLFGRRWQSQALPVVIVESE